MALTFGSGDEALDKAVEAARNEVLAECEEGVLQKARAEFAATRRCLYHDKCAANPTCWLHLQCMRHHMTEDERVAFDKRLQDAFRETAPEIARIMLRAGAIQYGLYGDTRRTKD
jgi:hypothetical protein